MKRPNQRPVLTLSQQERDKLAAKAKYTGSPEHKRTVWWGGLPEARVLGDRRIGRSNTQQTTECDLTSAKDKVRATTWVREAIKAGQCKYFEGNKTGFPNRVWPNRVWPNRVWPNRVWPNRVWYEADGRIWIGWCINRASGEYKGWPIDEDERNKILGRMD